MGLKATFWGVRGSVPTPAPQYLGHGGNTPCVELSSSSEVTLVFDAGTGIRNLGLSLARQGGPRQIHLFLTHFHWDHLHGLPYFAPLFDENAHIVFYSTRPVAELRTILENVMMAPHSPIPWNASTSQKTYVRVGVDEPIEIGCASVRAFPLNHPQGASGYRIESDNAAVVYASDTDHGDPTLDRILIDRAASADLLIYDAQFTPEQHETEYRGWGHSTWKQAVAVAQRAQVNRLTLFHHDPGHDDATLDRIVALASSQFANVTAARENSWAVSCRHGSTKV
jgi:phosphoribosyl 1,2-cyclic phosphodiesterase